MPTQAVAVCGESRTHGDNGGDGETQFGCALCPYPLRTGGQRWCAARCSRQRSGVGQPPPLSVGVAMTSNVKSGQRLFEGFRMVFSSMPQQSRRQSHATGDPAAIRGVATT